jgi:hypothetical protein
MKKNTFLTALSTGAICVLLTAAAHAQAPGSGGPGPDPTPTPDPTAVPLDGGASLLLASGVALGIKKLRDRRRAR